LIGTRRQARTIALKILFEVDVAQHRVEDVVKRYATEDELAGEVAEYARYLAYEVWARRKEIDGIIAKAAPAWPVEQMPSLDKNILRIAIFEILFDNKLVPAKVAINEAVELAKEYGGQNSPRFVNGVLGTVMSQQP
jgi:N utilization substance protein B